MSGAQLRLLYDEGHLGPMLEPLADHRRAVTDDDGRRFGLEDVCGSQDVLDERLARQPMEDLWAGRLHAGPLPRRKHHDVNAGSTVVHQNAFVSR